MKDPRRVSKLFYLWAPVLFDAALISFLSSFSFHDPLFLKVQKNNVDKLFHIVEYAVFGLLLARALWGHSSFWHRARRVFCTALFIGVLYGALDEYHQRFVPYRESKASDLAADAIGVMAGAWLWIKKQKRAYA